MNSQKVGRFWRDRFERVDFANDHFSLKIFTGSIMESDYFKTLCKFFANLKSRATIGYGEF